LIDALTASLSQRLAATYLKGAVCVTRLLVYSVRGWLVSCWNLLHEEPLAVRGRLSTRQNSDPASLVLRMLQERDVLVSEPRNAAQRLHEFGVYVYSVCCHFHRARVTSRIHLHSTRSKNTPPLGRVRTAAAVPAVSTDPFSTDRGNTIFKSNSHAPAQLAKTSIPWLPHYSSSLLSADT